VRFFMLANNLESCPSADDNSIYKVLILSYSFNKFSLSYTERYLKILVNSSLTKLPSLTSL